MRSSVWTTIGLLAAIVTLRTAASGQTPVPLPNGSALVEVECFDRKAP